MDYISPLAFVGSTLVGSLIGSAASVMVTQRQRYLEIKLGALKNKNEVIYFLLHCRERLVFQREFYPQIDMAVKKVIDGVGLQNEPSAVPTITAIIQITLNKIYEKHMPQIEGDILLQFNAAVQSLSGWHPVLAYELSGAEKYIPLLKSNENILSQLLREHEDMLPPAFISQVSSFGENEGLASAIGIYESLLVKLAATLPKRERKLVHEKMEPLTKKNIDIDPIIQKTTQLINEQIAQFPTSS